MKKTKMKKTKIKVIEQPISPKYPSLFFVAYYYDDEDYIIEVEEFHDVSESEAKKSAEETMGHLSQFEGGKDWCLEEELPKGNYGFTDKEALEFCIHMGFNAEELKELGASQNTPISFDHLLAGGEEYLNQNYAHSRGDWYFGRLDGDWGHWSIEMG